MSSTDGMMDMLKVSTLMGSMGGGAGAATSGSSTSGAAGMMGGGMMNIVYITIIQMLFKVIEQIISIVKKVVGDWWQQKVNEGKQKLQERLNENMYNVGGESENNVYTHIFERRYDSKSNNTINMQKADAIMYKVMNQPNIRSIIRITDRSIVNEKNEVSLTDTITFKVNKVDRHDEDIKALMFTLSSTVSSMELTEYEDVALEEYTANKNNSIGLSQYYFDQEDVPVTPDMKKNGMCPPIFFAKHKFSSNRKFSNIFFEGKEQFVNRFRFFTNNKQWYDERGIPYTLGILMHGPPGCGKTSTLKAIANETGRHIINIHLKNSTGKKELKALFYSPFLDVSNCSNSYSKETYYIPAEKRIFVIEDADAVLNSILVDRTLKEKERKEQEKKVAKQQKVAKQSRTKKPGVRTPAPAQKGNMLSLFKGNSNALSFDDDNEGKDDTNELDLATILNILDGTLEIPGRVFVVSSNHAERFDKAFIRPGRLDMVIEFKLCNREIIKEMFVAFYGFSTVTEEEVDALLLDIDEYKWTPAEVVQILFNFFSDNRGALVEMAVATPKRVIKSKTLKVIDDEDEEEEKTDNTEEIDNENTEITDEEAVLEDPIAAARRKMEMTDGNSSDRVQTYPEHPNITVGKKYSKNQRKRLRKKLKKAYTRMNEVDDAEDCQESVDGTCLKDCSHNVHAPLAEECSGNVDNDDVVLFGATPEPMQVPQVCNLEDSNSVSTEHDDVTFSFGTPDPSVKWNNNINYVKRNGKYIEKNMVDNKYVLNVMEKADVEHTPVGFVSNEMEHIMNNIFDHGTSVDVNDDGKYELSDTTHT